MYPKRKSDEAEINQMNYSTPTKRHKTHHVVQPSPLSEILSPCVYNRRTLQELGSDFSLTKIGKQVCDGTNDSTSNKENSSNEKYCFSDAFNSTPLSFEANFGEQVGSLHANFKMYIYALASQALDSNFSRIMNRKNDDYFLSNVHNIEEITKTLAGQIHSKIIEDTITDFYLNSVRPIISMYPKATLTRTNKYSISYVDEPCAICGNQTFPNKQGKFLEICLYSDDTDYDAQTMENTHHHEIGTSGQSSRLPIKIFQCCDNGYCKELYFTLHNLVHLKYHLYDLCRIRINDENRNSINNKLTQDTTTVLNRLLADDEWIEKLFQNVCDTWSKANMLISNK